MAVPPLRADVVAAIQRLAAQHGVHNVRVFGSFARGTATAASDIDFLVDFPPDRGGFAFVRFCDEMSALLKRPVDVVTERSLPRSVHREIIEEAKPLAQVARG